MASTLGDSLLSKRILICVGSGGVGKTTTAAALALAGAQRGKRTLVLTIDPARRLANSLGLTHLDHEERRIPEAALAPASPVPGALHAMMLDQKRTFDELVGRYARDPEVRARVLANRLYQQISTRVAGSHEYAAMAKLQQIDREARYDLVVVDTPPTAHALDFLDAPQKVIAAIESPAIEWFVRPLATSGRFSMKLIGIGGAFVMRRIARFVGSALLAEMAQFFVDTRDVLAGFRPEAQALFNLLRRPHVGFVIVASPDAGAVNEAVFFHKRLVKAGMPVSGLVVNRVHPETPAPPPREELAALLAARPECARFAPYELLRAADALCASTGEIRALAESDRRQSDRLAAEAGPSVPLVEVPFFDRDVHDVAGLAELGKFLVGS